MYEPETNISEEDLELYADYAVEHAAEIAKIIEQAVETNKVRFKEYLIFMIWCDLDDDTDKITIYDPYYDEESGKLGEMHEDHTATYDEVTVKDFLDFPDMSQRPYYNQYGLCYHLNSEYISYKLYDYTYQYILKDIKKYIENVFYIQMTDDDLHEFAFLTDGFDESYSYCKMPPLLDAEFIADYTGINDMTLREVMDYEFETNIENEFPDD